MYRIFVAEDEPAALNHILTLIELKCPRFEVTGTADNGKTAFEQMEKQLPDVLITDVRMPLMDGIELVCKVKEKYPSVLSVIISGYQEFDYARAAIQAGVCDYILKPVKPSVFQDCMRTIRGKLDKSYYTLRNRMLHKISTADTDIIDKIEFSRIFSEEGYYVALFRKNGLPQRFVNTGETEIFSIPEEQIMVYGRDEMETLCICPRELMVYGSFYELMQHIIEKEKRSASFYTLVLLGEAVPPAELPSAIQRLYQKLDSCLVIGKNRTIMLPDQEEQQARVLEEGNDLEYLRHLLSHGERRKATEEVERCFAEWEKREYTQLVIEDKVREIFGLFRRHHMLEESVEACGYYMDDAFYYAENMKRLTESVLQILGKNSNQEMARGKIDTQEYFERILCYMTENLANPLSPQMICRVFGISQTYLCRLFRSYSSKSFSKMLNEIRIEKACEIMNNRNELFVKDIAAMVGYADQFYFSRIFRAVKGVSPSEYMEKLSRV